MSARIFSDGRLKNKVSCRYGKQNRKEKSEGRSVGVPERLFFADRNVFSNVLRFVKDRHTEGIRSEECMRQSP